MHVQSAQEQAQHFVEFVASLRLRVGTSLSDKLAEVETAISVGNRRATCNGLAAFLREIRAQAGKAIEVGDLLYQSGGLTTTATRIRTVLGCS